MKKQYAVFQLVKTESSDMGNDRFVLEALKAPKKNPFQLRGLNDKQGYDWLAFDDKEAAEAEAERQAELGMGQFVTAVIEVFK